MIQWDLHSTDLVTCSPPPSPAFPLRPVKVLPQSWGHPGPHPGVSSSSFSVNKATGPPPPTLPALVFSAPRPTAQLSMAPTHSHHTLSLRVHAQHPWVGLENVPYFPGVCVLFCCLQRFPVPCPLWKPPASSPRVHSQLMALCLLTEKAGHPKGPSRLRAHIRSGSP